MSHRVPKPRTKLQQKCAAEVGGNTIPPTSQTRARNWHSIFSMKSDTWYEFNEAGDLQEIPRLRPKKARLNKQSYAYRPRRRYNPLDPYDQFWLEKTIAYREKKNMSRTRPIYSEAMLARIAKNKADAQRRRRLAAARGGFVPRVYGNPIARSETKYFDIENTDSFVGTTGSWTDTELDPAGQCLCYPTQGTGASNRIGRKIQILKIKIRGQIQIPIEVDTTVPNVESLCNVRLILYQDKQSNGVQAQGEDVMQSGAASLAFYMFQNPNNWGRFRVLKDKIWQLGNNTNVVEDAGVGNFYAAGNTIQFNWKHKFVKPLIVNYKSNGGSIADIVDNSFHLIGLATDIDPRQPAIFYKCRTTFKDV